jgi:hypothetical protein
MSWSGKHFAGFFLTVQTSVCCNIGTITIRTSIRKDTSTLYVPTLWKVTLITAYKQ